jgi:hypothetical protein
VPLSDKNFVERHSQTEVLVVNVPNRFDLGEHSCVNYEVKVFNRKLDKHMKSFQNAATVEVTLIEIILINTVSI